MGFQSGPLAGQIHGCAVMVSSDDSSTTVPALFVCCVRMTPNPLANHSLDGPSLPGSTTLIRQVSAKVLPPSVSVSKPSKVQVSCSAAVLVCPAPAPVSN